SLGSSNVLLTSKSKNKVLNWFLMFSAIRKIADKDCRPNEPHGRGERGCRAGSESAPVRLAGKLPEGMAQPQYFAQAAGEGGPACPPSRLR
ncbi:hypothetical protein, partial [Yersinia mollaretii]